LVLPLKQDSLVQRFSFDFPAKIRQQDNEEQIDYQDVIEFICWHPSITQGFIAAEQSLLGGHNLHPASKTHEGWDQQQAQIYSPDYAGEFVLHWFLVKAELLSGESAFANVAITIPYR